MSKNLIIYMERENEYHLYIYIYLQGVKFY